MGTFSSIVENLLRKAETKIVPVAKHIAERWIKRGSSSIGEIGPEGKMIAEGLRNFSEKHRSYFGEYTAARDKIFKSINKPSDVLKDYEGYFTKKKPAPTDVQELVDFDRATNLAAYQKAAKSGIKVGPPNPDDWSRVWPRGFFEGTNRNSSIKHLVDSGQARNEAEASKLLDMLAGRSKGAKSHLLVSGRRVDLPGFRTDIVAPVDAMDQKLKHIAMHETFGPNAEVLSTLLSEVKRKYGSSAYQLADKYTDVFLRKAGANYHPYSNAEQTVNSVLAARYLGTAVLKNIGQISNALLYARRMKPIIQTVKSIIDDYGNADEFAVRSGAILSKSLTEIRTSLDQELGGFSSYPIFRYTGFSAVERFLRIFSNNLGSELAKDLVAEFEETGSKLAKNKLTQLGIDVERALKQGLTEQDLLKAGMRTSDITQFIYNVEQLPIAWRDHPLSRMLTQYKPFAYMQGQLILDEVVRPAMRFVKTGGREGEILPLAYFSLIFPTFGEITADLSHLATRGNLSERPEAKYWLDRAVENISYVGGIGIFQDLIYAMTTTPERIASNPLMSEIVDIIRIPFAKDRAKQVARQIPVVGPLVSRKIGKKRPHREGFLERGTLTKGLYKIFGATP